MKKSRSPRARRFWRTAFALSFVTGLLAVIAACDAANSLVGGSCASNLVACNAGECVDINRDPANCGKCGVVCAAGVGCAAGICTGSSIDGSLDGPLGDGQLGDGQLGDGQLGDGSNVGDGSNTGDGSNIGDGSIAEGSLNDACVPPFNSAAHCGACNIQCIAPNNACNAVDGGFACGPFCTDPLLPTECNGVCVDLTSDPFNCGACAKVCPSGICTSSLCQGTTPGDIVLIGHDFSGAVNAAPPKLLTNAVFIPTTNPLRVLSYEKFANATSVSTIKTLVNTNATTRNRTVKYTVSNTASDLAGLGLETKFDVVLVYDQATMTAAEAATEGASDAAALAQFTKAGGVVIVLDGANGQEAMPPFITNAGLVSLLGHTFLPTTPPPPTHATVVAPADDVGTLTVSPYAVSLRSVSFQSNEPNGGNMTFVVLTGDPPGPFGDPIVLHKIVP